MRVFIAVFTAAGLLLAASFAFASEAIIFEGVKEKFWKGIVNTCTGWMEFPAQIGKGYNEGFPGEPDNRIGGALFGIFDGIAHSLGRTLSGAYDLATFWAADPKSNVGVGFPLDAGYAWEEGAPYDYFSPDFAGAALEPVWKKLGRGTSNALLGFMDLPGQTVKGFSMGRPVEGVAKGLWYSISRGLSGIYDLTTLALPVPEDNAGFAMEEEWPWDALTAGY